MLFCPILFYPLHPRRSLLVFVGFQGPFVVAFFSVLKPELPVKERRPRTVFFSVYTDPLSSPHSNERFIAPSGSSLVPVIGVFIGFEVMSLSCSS